MENAHVPDEVDGVPVESETARVGEQTSCVNTDAE